MHFLPAAAIFDGLMDCFVVVCSGRYWDSGGLMMGAALDLRESGVILLTLPCI